MPPEPREPEYGNGQAAVVFRSVSVTLAGVPILDGVSASAPRGSCTAIVGPNGAGKTTMLLALLGHLPYEGRIEVACGTHAPRLGYVPQRLDFDRGMPLTVTEFLVLGSQRSPLLLGLRREQRRRALELLSAVGAEPLAARRLGALSGGELQRVLLALALGQEPDLLVLDEPAAGVDFKGEHVFCELLESLRGEHGFTQLMVSHDLATVAHHATHVICLNRRVAAEGPPGEVLNDDNLAAVFGPHRGYVGSEAIQHTCPGPPHD